jgi:hypothetical protein
LKKEMSDEKSNPSNWYNQLESNRQFVIGAVVLLCCAITIVISLRNPVDYDSFWHLQMGKDLVENRLSPYQDHYSFTYKNETITSPPVLFQVGLYSFVKLFGEWGGFIAFKLLAFLLTIGLMLAWLKQIKAPALVYCLVLPMLVMLIQYRAQLRPELISYSLSIIALILYQRTRLQLSIKAITPIALFLLFWINYHSAILGYVIFFGLFIDIGFKLIKEKAEKNSWLSWAGWGVILVAIGFINSSMAHPVYGSLTFPEVWKGLIEEYQSPLASKQPVSVYILVMIAVTTLAMAAKQRKFGYLVCGGIFLYSGLTMVRMITPTGIIFLGMFAHLLSNTKIKSTFESQSSVQLILPLLLSIAIFFIPLWENITYVRNAMQENRSYTHLFPERLASYMLDNNKTGRIFNSYGIGGFLIHRLTPKSQVYIDGRTGILYPPEHFELFIEARRDAKALSAEIEQYGIDFVVLPSIPYASLVVMEVGGLALDFVDTNYALYSRKDALLPMTGKLWAKPFCWNDEQSTTLSLEWQAAQLNLPANAPVMPLLAIAANYSSAQNREDYLKNLATEDTQYDDSKRFAGYRALDHGLNNLAIELFSSIEFEVRHRKDFLALALAHLRDGQLELTEQILARASKIYWSRLEFNDILIMRGLLTEIRKQKPLEHITQEFLDGIFSQAGSATFSEKNRFVSVATFCGKPQEPAIRQSTKTES